MAQNRLTSLEISHFRSVKGTLKLNFPERGLVLIRASNKDTNGSSGGGKSTVMLALNAVLDCCPYPMTELQSWGVEDPVAVKLSFQNDKYGEVVVSRGAKNALMSGASKLTSAKSIAEKMQEILGYTPEMIRALTYWPQQDLKDFLNQTNSQKQEFLSSLLGLEKFEQAVEVARQQIKDLSQQALTSQTNLSALERALYQAKQQSALVPVPADVQPLHDQLVQLKAELVVAQGAVTTAQQAVSESVNATKAAVAKVEAAHQPNIAAKEQALIAVQVLLAEVKARPVPSSSEDEERLSKYISDAKLKLKALHDAENERADELQKQTRLVNNELVSVHEKVRSLHFLYPTRDSLQKTVTALQASRCPTCERTWEKAAQSVEQKELELAKVVANIAEAEAQKLPERLKELEAKQTQLQWIENPLVEQFRTRIAQWERELAVAKQKRFESVSKDVLLVSYEESTTRAALGTEKQALYHAKAQIELERREIEAVDRRNLLGAIQAVKDIESRIVLTESEIKRSETVNQHYAEMRAEFDKQVAARHAEVDEASISHGVLLRKVSAEQDFVRLVGREGFLGAIFDEVLSEISAETNEILGRVANTTNVTLEFRSEVETKKGAISKEIRPIITIGGYEASLLSGCSGGMYTAVRLAVRLAMRRVIERRVGKSLPWMCLDESFEGLDPVSKETCMEILAEAGRESLILVVDHTTEFKELFSETIDLQFKGGETTLAQ
jgi:DNA repair exonuclease SbcCD ATPase subunit